MKSIAESYPEQSRVLPDKRICQRVPIGLTGKIFECVVNRPHDCPHAVMYNNVFFCVNPNFKK